MTPAPLMRLLNALVRNQGKAPAADLVRATTELGKMLQEPGDYERLDAEIRGIRDDLTFVMTALETRGVLKRHEKVR